MKKICIVPKFGKSAVYTTNNPTLTCMSKKDFNVYISNLELEIRTYFAKIEATNNTKVVQPP